MHVCVDVEIGVDFPVGRAYGHASFDHAHAKAVHGREAFFDCRPVAGKIGRFVQERHAGHHHEIGGIFHVEPRRVDTGHGLCFFGHDSLLF